MSCAVVDVVKLDPASIPGLHGRFLAERLAEVLKHATADDLKRWRALLRPAHLNDKGADGWFSQASADERQALLDAQTRSRTSIHALAKALKDFKSPTAFAEPLLKAELKSRLGVDYDVNTAQLVEIHYEPVPLTASKRLRPVQQTLIQAAMQNYAARKTFEQGSALTPKGAFILELQPGHAGAYPRFQYRFCEKLSISPERFASLCHALDLGKQYQQHISHLYENPATQTNVRTLSITAQKDHLRQVAQTAFMKNEITEAGRTMINALVDGERAPLFHDKPVRCHSLSMFNAALDQVVVFSADRLDSGREESIIVYLPGAPLYPLKEYPSVAAFKSDLRINLLNPAYQTLFRSYVEKKEQPHFFKRLEQAAYDKYGQFDANANLYLRDATINVDLFGYLQDRHLLRLKANARDLLVPSADVDEAARKLRLAYWESIGLNALNAAAFFVPVLGAVMAVVAAVQLVGEIIDGFNAWEAGDTDEALAHFESVALNVVVAAGLGAAGHVGASFASSEPVDGLLQVTLPNGQQRLWKPDLTPYARDVELSGTSPDAQGVYALDSKSYVRIGKQTFEVIEDGNEKWSICHPDDPQAYQPALKHNGEGIWQAEGEQPLQWSHEQLLQRLGHATDGLSDEQVEQALKVSGVNDDVLRRMHVEQLPLPPLLKETLQRYQIDRRVTRLINSLRDGAAGTDGLELGPSLSQDLARWPQRVIEVFDEAHPDHEAIRYGASRWPDGRVIRISLRELYANQLAERVLADLSEGEALEFFGSSVETEQRLPVLRTRIAEHAAKRRGDIFKILHEHGRAPRTAEQALLLRDFPKLSDAAAQEIIDSATAAERQQLQSADGRIPMRLAEEARVYQRQSVLLRAIQGLHEGSLASLDSDRLAVGLLPKLPGWSNTVRLELREDNLSGRLLASAGKADGELKVIVRSADGYTVYDAQGLELSKGEPLYASLLKALPDSERQALGLHIGAAQALQRELYTTAVTNRGAAASALGQQPIKPWLRPPMRLADGRVGYTLGGAVGSMAIDAKLNALFPNLPAAEFERLKASLLEENQHLGDAVFKLQAELRTLEQTLEAWVAEGGDMFQRAVRERTRRQLLSAWRRQGGRRRAELLLEGGDVSPLPRLTARFGHISTLRLQRAALETLPDGFLRCFLNLEHLSLESNHISELGPEIAHLTQLRTLDLRENSLASSDSMFDVLKPLTRLQTLNLQSCGLRSIPRPALQALASLPALSELNLRYNELALGADALETLARLPLQTLDLSSTNLQLDEAGAAVFSRFNRLQRLRLTNNPLGRAPALENLSELEELDVQGCRLNGLPAGLLSLMNREPCALRSVDLSRNEITQVPELATTQFGQNMRNDAQRSYRLNLFYNPLDAQSIARLSAVGENFMASDVIYVEPDHEWLRGATEANRALWQQWFGGRRHAQMRSVLERLANSRDFQNNPEYLRARVWSMLRLACESTQLREELLAIVDAFPITCGDAGADAFSAMEVAVLVYERSALATTENRSTELVALYKQLFRRHEVQRMADVLALKRTLRRQALIEGVTAPALDPLDDISDDLLRRDGVDDIEIRLALRQSLASELDYPEPSSEMLYRATANLSEGTTQRVAKAVKAGDTPANRQTWMVQESNWQRYLKQRYAAQFDSLHETWAKGLEYLDYCSGTSEELPDSLDSEVLQALRTALGKEPLAQDGGLSNIEINGQEYLDAANALAKARDTAEQALMARLTQALEAES